MELFNVYMYLPLSDVLVLYENCHVVKRTFVLSISVMYRYITRLSTHVVFHMHCLLQRCILVEPDPCSWIGPAGRCMVGVELSLQLFARHRECMARSSMSSFFLAMGGVFSCLWTTCKPP